MNYNLYDMLRIVILKICWELQFVQCVFKNLQNIYYVMNSNLLWLTSSTYVWILTTLKWTYINHVKAQKHILYNEHGLKEQPLLLIRATGNMTEYKQCSYSLCKAFKQTQRQYRDKVESQLNGSDREGAFSALSCTPCSPMTAWPCTPPTQSLSLQTTLQW